MCTHWDTKVDFEYDWLIYAPTLPIETRNSLSFLGAQVAANRDREWLKNFFEAHRFSAHPQPVTWSMRQTTLALVWLWTRNIYRSSLIHRNWPEHRRLEGPELERSVLAYVDRFLANCPKFRSILLERTFLWIESRW